MAQMIQIGIHARFMLLRIIIATTTLIQDLYLYLQKGDSARER